ncbi:DinB family protein [Chitinophaga sp. sic0106]|uniref:DinB family protein n=1 Tax=Chitinophaga sp. sic0106 TaxID=2854785 RepID=UPI001C450790|nr:DinB family protein [Chitinophaga sp. sic0106]MBV7529692.1 DinB family protein [Chitinophaga sp. sic0106]
MNIIELLLTELKTESATTRKMLQRVPDGKFDYKPHEKSMSMGRLATHLAEVPGWIPMVLNTEELNFEEEKYEPRVIPTNAELVAFFEEELQKGEEALSKATEADLQKTWTMRSGDQIWSTSSKYEVIRMVFGQIIHHRAQLGYDLRLLDVPIPGSYGPSADEN